VKAFLSTPVGVVAALLILAVNPAFSQTPDGGYRSFTPDGPGPHPAVVFVSGCSGFAPAFAPGAYERVAEQLRRQGHMVIYADYLGRRNLKSCSGGAVTHAEAAKDLVAASTWLKSKSSVDPARITALGWSYGGGAVLVALGRHTEDQLGFSRAVVYYPDCRSVSPWKVATPVLMLLASDDDVAPGKPCEAFAKKSAVPEATKIVWYPGAFHAFDTSELPPRMRGPIGTIGYHPEAAASAWKEVELFLKGSR
jgi:dienelactone hydrolase